MASFHSREVRPYQLLCLICRSGGNTVVDARSPRLLDIAEAIRRDPTLPITLRCNVSSLYRMQNPGHDDDTPEGELYNAKRDLDIVQRLGLVPGDTRPAWELMQRIMEMIPSAAGICGYGACTTPAWTGCPSADSGYYERGVALGVDALIPPRSTEEMARVKDTSAREIAAAEILRIRPHHLLCMACFHKGQKSLAPIAADNLYEVIAAIWRNPDIPVMLVSGCCMICPPCSHYDPASGLCVRTRAMGLRDEKKDLDTLQRLGLRYGDTLPARELYRRLFATIHSTREICGCGDGVVRGWEWTSCGREGNPGYEEARRVAMHIPGLEPPETTAVPGKDSGDGTSADH